MNSTTPETGNLPKLIAAWALVGIPFAWGVFVTLNNVLKLFG